MAVQDYVKLLASFLNTHFEPVQPVTEFHINVSQGATSALERLAFELGDPGDKFLLGRPYYCSYQSDLRDRAGIEIAPVSFGSVDPCSEAAVSCYEAALLSDPSKIRAILLCNPHNPLGRCYPKETLIALMRLCQKHSIHLIVDEIYALSVFPNPETPNASPFISALSIDTSNIINPSLIHTLWGLSKDFGANSLRIGCVVSQHNPTLHSVLDAHASYSFPSALLDYAACTILEDPVFVRSFLTENKRRLAENYRLVTSFLRKHRIPFQEANAGCFVWIDLGAAWRERRRYCTAVLYLGDAGWVKLDRAFPDEMEGATSVDDDVMRALVKERVYLASGEAAGGEVPGWFRLVFSVKRVVLVQGLRRVIRALKA